MTWEWVIFAVVVLLLPLGLAAISAWKEVRIRQMQDEPTKDYSDDDVIGTS
jgi:hypothetical protein